MKKTSIFALVLALVLCMSLFAGCAPKEGGEDTGETIKFGFLGPLTGPVAQYGIAIRNGIKMYVDELNAAGGLLGKQIELIEYDEKGDAQEAINGFNKLVEQDKVVAVFGSVTSGPTFAVADASAAMADPIPVITSSATADDITASGDNMFRTCFKDSFQGGTMARYAAEIVGANTAAIIFNNSTDYSTGLKDAFEAECKNVAIDVVSVESYGENTVDFKAQLTNIAAKNPEVLFVPDYYTEAALIAQQARELGIEAVLLGGDGWDTVIETSSEPSTLAGSFYSSHYSADDPASADFVAKYKEKFNADPIAFSATGYDSAMVMFDAVKRANSTDHAAVIAALKETDLDCVTSHITFDEDNNPIKDCYIIGIEDDGSGNYTYKFDRTF